MCGGFPGADRTDRGHGGSNDPADRNFLRELEAGKMLDVLVAADTSGLSHTLFAFSGQLGDGGFHHPGFVGPAFDYLLPEGHFRTEEARISRANIEISQFEGGPLARIRSEYERARKEAETEIGEYKEKCRRSKMERDGRRSSGKADDEGMAAMIRRSQFEKAELRRLKKRLAADLAPLEAELRDGEFRLAAMKERRRADSEALQQWLFSNFTLLNARGESRSLRDIFADTPMVVPPLGAGQGAPTSCGSTRPRNLDSGCQSPATASTAAAPETALGVSCSTPTVWNSDSRRTGTSTPSSPRSRSDKEFV